MKNCTKRFWHCTRGIAINEFALILPLMLILWAGLVEFGNLHSVSRKVALSAQSTADLIAQQRTVTISELNDIVAAGHAILFPYPVDTMGFTFQSIPSNADASIDTTNEWIFNQGTAEVGVGEIPPEAETLLRGNDSTIYVRASYTHSLTLASLIPGIEDTVQLTESAFAKPRKVLKIFLE